MPTFTPADAKQAGSTASERHLAALCERSFLALWSYPNVYRDQGKLGEGDGKELCDVMAVFGNHVMLFSDKKCEFPSGPVNVAWRRWYKRAIDSAVRQLNGSERWIRLHPDRLYLDRRCRQPFPIDLPGPDVVHVHRIVVARGANAACRQTLDDESGSLMFCPDLPSPVEPEFEGAQRSMPFVVGRMPSGLVHVLDDATLSIVMRELDTASDFVAYLSEKEALISRGDLFLSMGEEHLLAAYLTNCLRRGEPTFPRPPSGYRLTFDASLWPGLCRDPLFRDAKDDLRPSYAWDGIIQDLANDILADRMTDGNEAGSAGHERRVRALASAPRRVRRDLVLRLLALVRDTAFPTHFRALQHPLQPDTAYLFLVLKREGLDDAKYRATRGALMHAYCMVFSHRNPDTRHVVGISTGPAADADDRSHEVVYVDRRDWRPEDDLRAAEVAARFGIFRDIKREVL